MTALFKLTFGASIFFALALPVFFFVTAHRAQPCSASVRSHTTTDTSAKRYDGQQRRPTIHVVVHWVRARLGLIADVDMPERLANAGYKARCPPISTPPHASSAPCLR